jgi:hypothetical protein
MNSNNKSSKISYVISHMQTLVDNREFRASAENGNINRRPFPYYNAISTRGINVITMTKLLKPLDSSIAESIKENILDQYNNNNVSIIIIFNNKKKPYFIAKISMRQFINYLTDTRTNDANMENPTNNIKKILEKKLLYRSKKFVYIIYNKQSKLKTEFKNVFYNIQHHPLYVFDMVFGSGGNSKDIFGKYYLDKPRKLKIPVDVGKQNTCSLNSLFDSYKPELPQCIILLGCRTLARVPNNHTTPIKLLTSTTTFLGAPFETLAPRNTFSSENANNYSAVYRTPSSTLRDWQFRLSHLKNNTSNNTSNNKSLNNNNLNKNSNIEISDEYIENIIRNNNQNNLNDFEYKTFKEKYKKKNQNASFNTIRNEYKKFMKKRLLFALTM